jgi:hypothetical protein
MTGVAIEDAAHEVAGVVLVYVGIGVTAGVALGYPDRAGYHMIGVEGTVASGLGVGFTIKVGVHASGRSMRVVSWLGNIGLDVTVSLREDVTLAVSSSVGAGGSSWGLLRARPLRTLLPEQMPILSVPDESNTPWESVRPQRSRSAGSAGRSPSRRPQCAHIREDSQACGADAGGRSAEAASEREGSGGAAWNV